MKTEQEIINELRIQESELLARLRKIQECLKVFTTIKEKSCLICGKQFICESNRQLYCRGCKQTAKAKQKMKERRKKGITERKSTDAEFHEKLNKLQTESKGLNIFHTKRPEFFREL